MKRATTVTQQIEQLKRRGMHFPDEQKANEVLNDIGYYRMGFYWAPFEQQSIKSANRKHKFKGGTTFTDALQLYYFNLDLRECLLRYTSRFELSFRRALIHKASLLYSNDPTWFSNTKVMRYDKTQLNKFKYQIYKEVKRTPTIQRHHKKYRNEIYAPAWKTLEFLTFGQIQDIYTNLHNTTLQLNISLDFTQNKAYQKLYNKVVAQQASDSDLKLIDQHIETFLTYIDAIRILRNQCAHHHPLFDFRLRQPIKAAGNYLPLTSNNNYNIIGCLLLIRYLITPLSGKRAREMTKQLHNIANKVNSPMAKTVLDPILKAIKAM